MIALSGLGWDDSFADAFASSLARPGVVPGRVSRPGRGASLVLTDSGEVLAHAAGSSADGRAGGTPAVGDWVGVDVSLDPPRLAGLLPRRTAFTRHDTGNSTVEQVLAANVDTCFLVVALNTWPNLRRLERFLALAWESGAAPVVVLTKSDTCRDVEAAVEAVESCALGVPVHAMSAVTGEGVDALSAYVGGSSTVVFLGQSGVGKSTLVNRLLGIPAMGTQAIRGDGKGRHTTTHRELRVLPGGGVLIDTPGLRGIGLWGAEDGLDKTFADVEELAAACRFHDCAHASEPGCAVLEAIEEGRLESRRLDSYRHLQKELRSVALRKDARLRAQARREAKTFYRTIRHQPHR